MDGCSHPELFPASLQHLPLQEAKALIQEGDEKGVCEEERNMLTYSVQRRDAAEAEELARYILESTSVEAGAVDVYGQTAVFYAAREGHVNCLKLLVDEHDLSVSQVDNESQTPLFYAAREGQCGTIQFLVDRGAVLDHVDRNGDTPLFYAARDGREEAVKLMLDLGADCCYRNKSRYYASYYAKARGHKKLASELEAARKAKLTPAKRKQPAPKPTPTRKKGKIASPQTEPIQSPFNAPTAPSVATTVATAADKPPKPDKDGGTPHEKTPHGGTGTPHGGTPQSTPKDNATATPAEEGRSLYCLQFEANASSSVVSGWRFVTPYKIEEFEALFPNLAVWDPQAVLALTSLDADICRSKWHALGLDLLRFLMEDVEEAKYFREPVDPGRWNIPDYFDIVKQPMDFGTIKTKLEVGVEYRTVSDLIHDLDLVFSNCILYNSVESQVGKICETVKSVCMEYAEQIGLLEVYKEEERLKEESSKRLEAIRQAAIKAAATAKPAISPTTPSNDAQSPANEPPPTIPCN